MLFDNAPVIIPTLNRYEHLKRCVASLANNRQARDTELVISLDYPPNEKYIEGWKKIKEYLPSIEGFCKVTILTADKNIGAANNCNKLRKYVKELGYDAFILSEDDNVFAPNFLDYMNWALKTYKDDDSILAVCGYKRVDVSFLKNNIYKYPRFNAWGYGMWFNRREKLDRLEDPMLQRDFINKVPVSIVFSRRIFEVETIMAMLNNRAVWGDALPFLLPREQQYCIFPKMSMVRNEGFDGSGLHNRYSNVEFELYHTGIMDSNSTFEPIIEKPLYDKSLEKAYRLTYKKTIKEYLLASLRFLAYRLTGRFILFVR